MMTKTCVGGGAAAALIAVLAATPSAVAAQGRSPGERSPRDGSDRPTPGRLVAFGPAIGVQVRDAAAADLTAAGVSQPGAAVVTSVSPNGPARRAGVLAGDVIVEFDGERVRGARQLARVVQESTPGRAVKVTVVREKSRRTMDVTPTGDGPDLADMREQIDRAMEEVPRALGRLGSQIDLEGFGRSFPFASQRRLGLDVQPLSAQLATFFGVSEGVLVASVRAESPAAAAGVKAGDVVTAVNGRPVREVQDLVEEAARGRAERVRLTVVRDKKEMALELSVPNPEPRPRRGAGRSI